MRILRLNLASKLLATALALAASSIGFARAEVAAVASKHRAERKTFTDAEIIDGFLKIAFGAEFHVAGRVDRIRKYDGPVRIAIDGAARPDRRRQLAAVIADIARHIQHLDLTLVADAADANVVVRLVRDRDMSRTLATFYGQERAEEINRSLDPQCLSSFRKNEDYAIERSDVILTVDAGDFTFLDCAYEEVLQSLGPINDTDSVPWTMFNDDVQKGYFDIYDQYILNILYDPRIRPGMTIADVTALLPMVLVDVRAFVAQANGPGR